MITGAHTILYAHNVELARAFFRDILGLVSVDAGDGWLIFALPPAELACHPGPEGAEKAEPFLMCQDMEATRRDLEAKNVEFVSPVTDAGYGLMTRLLVPGFGELGLYQPRHPSPLTPFK